jgi:protein-disulfide isomerase
MLQSAVPLLAISPFASGFSQALAQDAEANLLSEGSVLRDPEIPVAGNPDGDITIVEYFDFRCPYCKKVHPDLLQVVQDDGNIRLVYKDWPIFGGVSVDAAKLTLATKFQAKFVAAHNALIGAKSNLTEANVAQILTAAGIDADRAARDLVANAKAIDAILARSDAQAKAFGFQGTPAFIIGKFRVPGALSVDNFKQAIKDARAALKKT